MSFNLLVTFSICLILGEGGLKMSRLIDRHMIDYFIPFLPLERRHIIMCFKDYLRIKMDVRFIEGNGNKIQELADSLYVTFNNILDFCN